MNARYRYISERAREKAREKGLVFVSKKDVEAFFENASSAKTEKDLGKVFGDFVGLLKERAQ